VGAAFFAAICDAEEAAGACVQNASTVAGARIEGERPGAIVGFEGAPGERAADWVGGVHRCGTVAAVPKSENVPEFMEQYAAKIDGAGGASAIAGKGVFCSIEVDVPLARVSIGADPEDGLREGAGREARRPSVGMNHNA
jgi:hypothetical protein